jgi:WD40 repeat protein
LIRCFDKVIKLSIVAPELNYFEKPEDEIRIFKGHEGAVTACTFSPDGKYILSASEDGTVRMWEVETEKTIHLFKGHEGAVTACTFSPDGKYILSASRDGTLRLWDSSMDKEVIHWKNESSLTCCAFHPNGQQVMTADENGRIHFLRVVNLRVYSENLKIRLLQKIFPEL